MTSGIVFPVNVIYNGNNEELVTNTAKRYHYDFCFKNLFKSLCYTNKTTKKTIMVKINDMLCETVDGTLRVVRNK